MGRFSRWILLAVLAGGTFTVAGAGVFVQTAAGQAAQKQDDKDDKQLYKELATPYKRWLDEDVAYIISPDERRLFLKLQTNEEREQYIEAFWQRRNPDQDSPENTFKEEHYRRIAYANEHFGAGVGFSCCVYRAKIFYAHVGHFACFV